jgi:hypothetical protein
LIEHQQRRLGSTDFCIVAPAATRSALLLSNPIKSKEKYGCPPRAPARILVVRETRSGVLAASLALARRALHMLGSTAHISVVLMQPSTFGNLMTRAAREPPQRPSDDRLVDG